MFNMFVNYFKNLNTPKIQDKINNKENFSTEGTDLLSSHTSNKKEES